MKQIPFIILIFALILTGCGQLGHNSQINLNYNGTSLKQLIKKAVNGDTLSNRSLDNLINLNYPVNNHYILFNIDSTTANNGRKYYLILLNYSNPAYNRFAVYDSALRCFLLDKSLNGNIYESVLNIKETKYLKLTEDFNSKDVLTLNRISLFKIENDSVSLAFRDFTKLIENGIVYSQKITGITPDIIKTELSSTSHSIINNKHDVFYYNLEKKTYISPLAIFNDFVKAKVLNFKFNLEKPEIKDKNSLLASVNSNLFLDTIKTTSNTKDIKGFSLTLTDNWETLRNRTIPEYLKRNIKGTIFFNKDLGSSIYVIVIPEKDSAELFIKRKLMRSVSGKYKIRFSDKISASMFYVQYFEYTCGLKKYLLILKTNKSTYSKYRSIYQGIINSFNIDC